MSRMAGWEARRLLSEKTRARDGVVFFDPKEREMLAAALALHQSRETDAMDATDSAQGQ